MKAMKKILKYIGILLVGIIIAMIILPFLYKDEIITKLKDEINGQIDGELEFSDIDLSFFKSFPNVALTISDLNINSSKTSKHQNLLKAKSLVIDLELMSFIKKEEVQRINRIYLDEADIVLYTDKNNQSNYLLAKGNSNTADKEYLINLKSYEIKSSNLKYIDENTETFLSLENVDHEGEGDLSQDIFDLKHMTTIEKVHMEVSNVNYMDKVKLKSDMITKINHSNSSYEIETKELILNKLNVDAVGNVRFEDSDIHMDLNLKGKDEKFEDILSIIPAGFTSNLNTVNVAGDGSLDGQISGIYNSDNNSKPSIDFKIKADNGNIKSSDTSSQISNLNSSINISAKAKDWSDFNIQVPEFNALIDDQKIEGKFLVDNILEDPYYDADLKGKIDLEKLQKVIPVESVKSIKGNLDLDLMFKGKQSDIYEKRYHELEADNRIISDGEVYIDFADGESLSLNKIDIRSDKQRMEVKKIDGKIGASDFSMTGNIYDPLLLITQDGQAKGNLEFKSNHFDLNQFISEENTDQITELNVIPDDKLLMDFDLEVQTLKYQDYNITNLETSGNTSINSIELNKGSTKVNGSSISFMGNIENTYAYAFNNDTLLGSLNIYSPNFNVDQFLGQEESSNESEITKIPENISLLIDIASDKVLYDKYDLRNFVSELVVSHGKAIFSNTEAKTHGGKLHMDGIYDTTQKDPNLEFSYDIDNFSFKSLYLASDLFQKLAPIANYIDGKFNSDLSMNVNLKDGFELDYSSITADGFLQTLHGSLNDFIPIEEMAKKIGIKEISQIAIDQTKNWFTIKNGAVQLEPHDYEYEGIKLNIGGAHKLNQQIDYLAKIQVPRSLFEDNNGAVDLIDSGLDRLSKEASAIGVDIFNGDYIYLNVDITGSVFNPKFKITPTGSGGKSLTEQAKDELTDKINEVKDEIIQTGKDKTEEIKDSITEVATAKLDTLEQQAEVVLNEKKEEVVEKIGEVISSKVDSTIAPVLKDSLATEINKKLEDILKTKTSETDKIKDKLKDLNIFKKKGN